MLKLFPSFIPPCSSYSQVKTTNIVSDALPLSIEENKES